MRRMILAFFGAAVCAAGAVLVLDAAGTDDSDEIEGEIEREVTLAEVPDLVQSLIKREAETLEDLQVDEIVLPDGTQRFEAAWVVGDLEIEITISPEGRLLGREVGPADDGEDDE